MKRILLFIITALAVLPLPAQINFRDTDFTGALQAAKNENKLVFMDCYTAWCGPCKRLASRVFPEKKAGDHFNPRFVSIKMDMEKGEGVDLAKKYDVNAYPTLLVLSAEGEILCRHAGYLEVDALIAFVEQGIKGGGLTEMHRRYAEGERSATFIRDYLAQLDDAAMSSTLRTVADDFLRDKVDAVFSDTNIYRIFRAYAVPATETFRQVYARKGEYARLYGERAAQRLELTWEAGARKFLKRAGKNIVGYDSQGLDAYYTLMQECHVPEAEAIRAAYLLEGAIPVEEWTVAFEALRVYVTFSRLEEGTVHYACRMLEGGQTDPLARKKLATFVAQRLKALEGVEDTSGRTMTVGNETMPMLEYYRRSYNEILRKLQ